jgi:hypothetical protein
LQTQSGSWTRVKELSGCCTHTCLLNLCENNSFCILSVLCNKHNFTYSNTIMAVQEFTSCHCKAILLNTPNYIICPSIILPHVAYICSRSHKKTFNSPQLLWMDLFVNEHIYLPSSSSSSKTTTYHALWAREQMCQELIPSVHFRYLQCSEPFAWLL